ncbi:MAG: hypothetical protein ABIA75_00475 [Candidatus Neomarinimicrobiota bacterium]
MYFRKILTAALFAGMILSAQPDPRFDPFDWVLYRDTGAICSISEGPNFTYLGTTTGGVWRYNNYGRNLAEPLTTAQGLPDNSVSAIHLDRDTGILWVAGPGYLSYSYNREGDWYTIDFDDLGLTRQAVIRQIGSSRDYIWCRTDLLFVKCDHSSGILLGQMLNPDDPEINWSSAEINAVEFGSDYLGDYQLAGNWNIFGDGLLNPQGQDLAITTRYAGRWSDYWVGSSQRVVFHADPQIKILDPLTLGLNNIDIQFILDKRGFWVGGRSVSPERNGLSFVDPGRNIYKHFDFAYNANMMPQALFAALDTGTELWFGGESQVLVYNYKSDFWRTLTELDGVPSGWVVALAQDTTRVWLGATRGLARITKKTKQPAPAGIEKYYNEQFIYALEQDQSGLWIGSDFSLRYYNQSTNSLSDFKRVGDASRLGAAIDNYRYFTALTVFRKRLFVASAEGVISYDFKTGLWQPLLNPTLFSDETIRKMAVDDDYFWLLSARTLWRVDRGDNTVRIYNYDFMGILNDLYINGDEIWLGTSEGLIKFNWWSDL